MIDRMILITCNFLTFKYPETSNVHIDWAAILYFLLMAKKKKSERKEKKTVKKHDICTGYFLLIA